MTTKKTPSSAALLVDKRAAVRVETSRSATSGQKAAKAKPANARSAKAMRVEPEVEVFDAEPGAELDDAAAELIAAADEVKAKAKPLRVKVPKSKERALMREFGLDVTALTEEEAEKRRNELKTLIKMGKTRGFLTHQEINDHLPEKLVDHEILEAIVSMLNDMGIAVYEQAPDAATLLIAGGGATTATEEEAEEAAEAALSTVDSEFGRTTDPVRMYMREMGTVELLTREGEIEIAKRIEGGLQAMMLAISASPTTIAEILACGEKIAAGELAISDVVDGFVVAGEADDYVAEEDVDSFDDEDDDDGNGGSRALTRRLEEMKVAALARFAAMRASFAKLRKAYEHDGYGSSAYRRAQHALSDQVTTIRFTTKTIDKLCGELRAQVAEVRRHEREIRRIAVDRCGMPQEHFIEHFPPNALNLGWVEAEAAAGGAYAAALRRHAPAIQELQAKLVGLQAKVVDPARGPEGDQQEDERGRALVARRQARNDRGQPAPGDLGREEVHEPRDAVPRPDPGRQRRADEGGREVRVPPRLQVLDLRDLVDPPGDHAGHRRPGADDPRSGAHDRDDQQDQSGQPRAPAGVRLRARRRDDRAEARGAGSQDPPDHEDRQGAGLDGAAVRRRRRCDAWATSSRTRRASRRWKRRCSPACAASSARSSTA